ncbi:MAG: zf-HC2 domain-containing protein [Endomicrobia bacterium]|nr:zf-HC2 domain-containing protein [Endomicrobiia bacterium]
MNICDNLPLYVYGEMSAQEKQEFEKHLSECENCRNLKETFGEALEARTLRSAPAGVINAIFEKTSRKQPFFASMRMMKLAFAAAAFLLIGIGYFATVSHRDSLYDSYDYSSQSINEMISIDSDMDEYESMFVI